MIYGKHMRHNGVKFLVTSVGLPDFQVRIAAAAQ
jgi:hypothetical protein